MSTPPRRRSPSEVLRRGYSDAELAAIYELGRLWLENGDVRRGESIMRGINEVAPDYLPAWLAMAYTNIMSRNLDAAIACARQALRIDPENVTALLFLAAFLLSAGDVNSAGTYLGEIGERVDAGSIDDPRVVRFYRMQLARFQSR